MQKPNSRLFPLIYYLKTELNDNNKFNFIPKSNHLIKKNERPVDRRYNQKTPRIS